MSESTFMDKLLDGHVVEWKPLGELGELVRGNGLQKKDFTETGVPAIHYGQIYTYYGLSTTKTKSFVSPELAKSLRKVNKGDVVITNTSENIEDVGKALVYLGEHQAVTGGHATIFKPSQLILDCVPPRGVASAAGDDRIGLSCVGQSAMAGRLTG